MNNLQIKFIREYKINDKKSIPIGSIYEQSEEDSTKYISRDLGLPNMYKDFIEGPGKDYIIEYNDSDIVSLEENNEEKEIPMRWKIELIVKATKSEASDFRVQLEDFIKQFNFTQE